MNISLVIALAVLGPPAVIPWVAYGVSGRFPGLKFNLISALSIYIYVVCLCYGPYVPEIIKTGCFATHYEVILGGSISMDVCRDWPIVLIDSAMLWPNLAVVWLASLCALKLFLTFRPSMTKGAR